MSFGRTQFDPHQGPRPYPRRTPVQGSSVTSLKIPGFGHNTCVISNQQRNVLKALVAETLLNKPLWEPQ